MSVNLKKGEKVSLTKNNAGLRRVVVGLGWDEAESQPVKGGLLGRIGGTQQNNKQDIDCDAIAFLLKADGNIGSKNDVVFFNNLNHSSGCVIHHGDNLTGAGEGDDEQISVDLARLPSEYERIVILVSIYKATDRNQHFGMIKNAFIRLVDGDSGREICIYNLSENYDGMSSMVFGELYRRNGEWKFNAIGQPMKEWSVAGLAARYGLDRTVWR